MSKNINDRVNPQEIGYLAGIIDGEGYIALSLHLSSNKQKRQYKVLVPRIGLSNTDPGIIKKCKDILDKLDLKYHIASKIEPSGKESFTITVHRFQQLIEYCDVLIPALAGIKKAKAELVRDFCSARVLRKGQEYSKEEIDIFREFLEINKDHKGPKTRINEFLNDYMQN